MFISDPHISISSMLEEEIFKFPPILVLYSTYFMYCLLQSPSIQPRFSILQERKKIVTRNWTNRIFTLFQKMRKKGKIVHVHASKTHGEGGGGGGGQIYS